MDRRYFGVPDEYACGRVHFDILPVPFETTTSYGKGTAHGPDAILIASRQVEWYDDELRDEPYQTGIATLDPLDVTGSPADVMARIEERVAAIAAGGTVPIVIGGEHSITPPAVRGVSRGTSDITVVQLDAHADLRDSYEGTKLSHACAMARVREHFPTVQVGIRSLSRPEAELISQQNLSVFFAIDMAHDPSWASRALAAIKTSKVYLTIDIDALDPSLIPHTGTPEPGGMGWYETLSFIRTIATSREIVGMDLVELAPREGHHAADFAAAKLLYKCIGYIGAAKRLRQGRPTGS